MNCSPRAPLPSLQHAHRTHRLARRVRHTVLTVAVALPLACGAVAAPWFAQHLLLPGPPDTAAGYLAPAPVSVPEPSSLCLLGAWAVFCLTVRRFTPARDVASQDTTA